MEAPGNFDKGFAIECEILDIWTADRDDHCSYVQNLP